MYVCVSAFSNIFSSETTGPVKVKIHMEPPWDGGTKVRSTGPGHMTKIAAMPICGKNLKKSVCVYFYVCVSTFSNIFSSETTVPIKVKFHMEPPWDGGTELKFVQLVQVI